MAEELDSYEVTRARLEEIATAVRKKDVTLEKSIELLEEGVRLANLCTEQVDQATFAAVGPADPLEDESVSTDASGTSEAGRAEAAATGDVTSGSASGPADAGAGEPEVPEEVGELASAGPGDADSEVSPEALPEGSEA